MPITHKNGNKKNRDITKIYTKDEYNSGDGMLTTVWGPSLWHFLHIMSFNYPIDPTFEQKEYYRDFILNLKHILPCKYCRINLTENLKQIPLTIKQMENRDSFSRYIYNLHETVNKMLHKKSSLSFCEVRERYEHFRARCTTEKPKIFNFSKIKIKNKTIKNKKEKGCTEPLYGKKSKCIIKIVPQDEKGASFQMDKKCIKTK